MSVCLDIGCETLCRSDSCMLRCWMQGAVPIWFLYASVLDAGCCADLFFGDTAGCFIGYGLF